MTWSNENLLSDIAAYYSEKLAQHGETPLGVDWNGEESQFIRFKQIARILQENKHFIVHDLGCGYGAFYDYLVEQYDSFVYHGIDLSSDMIQAARKRYINADNAHFVRSNQLEEIADYTVASGIFNVRTTQSDLEWQYYLEYTLDLMNRFSRYGFAFNCLTSYSDPDKKSSALYYADPCLLFDLCKQRYSKNVALLHDYGLYEFTILVRKMP